MYEPWYGNFTTDLQACLKENFRRLQQETAMLSRNIVALQKAPIPTARTTPGTVVPQGAKILHGWPMGSTSQGLSTWEGTATYVHSTRTLTVSGTAWVQGVSFVFDSATVQHGSSDGDYFLYVNAQGELEASTTAWSLFTHVPIKWVHYVAASSTDSDWTEERHGSKRELDWHYTQHFAADGGTRVDSRRPPTVTGLVQGGNVPSSPTDTGNRPIVAAHTIFDEDIRHGIAAIAGGPTAYTTLNYKSGYGPEHRVGNADVYIVSGGYATWNDITNPTTPLAAATNGQYLVYFLASKPSDRAGYTTVAIPAQAVFNSVADANNYSIQSMNLSWLTAPEYTFFGKMVFRASSAYTTAGKVGLCSYTPLWVSRNASTYAPTVAVGYPRVARTETSGTINVQSNELHVFGTITTATFALTAPTNTAIANEYHWIFTSGSAASVITWPGGITWVGGSAPTIVANKKYEVSILENLAVAVAF